MTISLERREDGSVALFINGDLQFDSTDERIYHEALALPALAVVAKRIQSPLKVLVIGGGDGLIARELFKSSRVASLDLVDYDDQILSLAQGGLSSINGGSLSDPRITTHVQDAWDFVDQALERAASYDLIVSDLTVAENVMEARFHSVDWYAKLARLLPDQGVLAVNGVSPQATPQAYWCIFNSISKASLHARPYHINLPSFSASGFGEDWGFFMASPQAIVARDLDADLSVATPREFLRDNSELLRLFVFPEKLFEYQAKSLPALAGSDILLYYFNNAVPLDTTTDAVHVFALDSLDGRDFFVPEPDSGKHILPPALCSALAKSIDSSEQYDNTRPEGVQLFLHEVLDLMPSLQRAQTTEIIADFLEAPTRFLEAIDLPALVACLLRRAAELPAHLVAELRLLQNKLVEWADDQENLLVLGHRVLSILILAIVVGNLFYPDAVYAKAHSGYHGRGGGWAGGTTYYNNRRIGNPVRKGPIGPGPNDAAVKRMQREGSLPQGNDLSDAEYFDESGTAYPSRRYRTAKATDQTSGYASAVYRLGPGADILADGHVAMPLTDSSYLLLMPHATHVIEQQSGHCVISLHNDPELLSLTTTEISRQLAQLPEGTGQSVSAVSQLTGEAERLGTRQSAGQYLNKANEIFKNSKIFKDHTLDETPPMTSSPVTAADPLGSAVFPGVYLAAGGRYLAIYRESGQIAYLDGKNWYADLNHLPLSEPYPTHFRSVAISYLERIVREATATTNMLLADKHELVAHMDMLTNELRNYQLSEESPVNFGTRKLPRAEAIRLTQVAAHKTQLQIRSLDKHIKELPENLDMAKIALSIMSDERSA